MSLGQLLHGEGLGATATAAVAAGGAALLIVLHLLRLRRREVVVPFAPLWFATGGPRRATRWARRLRSWAALAMALAIFGLVLLAARNPSPAAADQAGRSLVVLIDRSASMGACDVPGTRLSAARARAAEIIGGMAAADRALIASFAADVVAESGFEAEPARLRRAIDGIAPGNAATPNGAGSSGDLGRALDFATAVLRGRPHPTVVLISDGGFPEDARRAYPAGVDLRYVPVGQRARNVAILSFVARRLPADPGAVQAALTVQNFGTERAAVALEILSNGKPADRLRLDLAPGERRRQELPDVFAPAARLEARLLAPEGRPLAEAAGAGGPIDDLASDDTATATVPPLPRRRVLRVGPPNLYLDGALLSLGRTVTVERLDAAGAERERTRWPDYDLVIFDGVAPSPPPTAGRYLYLDPHGPGNPFGERGMVRDPVISEARRDHPLLRQVDLADVNIAEARRLVPAPGDLALAGSFGAPLLLARERPGLRLAALSFALPRSDLPLRPALPLLLANALAWAGRGAPEAGAEHHDDFEAAALAASSTARDPRESDTAVVAPLAMGGRALPPPDPPARRPPTRLPELALLLAAALSLFEWVSYHRRWTT